MPKGVLERNGHTEALLDMIRLAGLKPGGALIKILNEDGTMARLCQLLKIAEKLNLKIISIRHLYNLECYPPKVGQVGLKYQQFQTLAGRV